MSTSLRKQVPSYYTGLGANRSIVQDRKRAQTTFARPSRSNSIVFLSLSDCLVRKKGIIMSQQEMPYSQVSHERAGYSYSGYEGTQGHHMSAEKLSLHPERVSPTATQRLILAIASLLMLMITIFGLSAIAALSEAPDWVIVPLLLILILFAAVVVIINVVFNRKS